MSRGVQEGLLGWFQRQIWFKVLRGNIPEKREKTISIRKVSLKTGSNMIKSRNLEQSIDIEFLCEFNWKVLMT
jgi:hypothetical protein